jgi:hypothetical protein
MLYVPEIGKRHSFCCGKADTPGSACFHHLEGSFPTRGEFGALLSSVLAVGLGPGPPSSLLCTIRWRWHLSAWLYRAFQVAACHLRNGGDVHLQEFQRVGRTVVLFQQVRQLGWPGRHAEMIRKCGVAYAGQRDTRLEPSAHWVCGATTVKS